MFHLVTHADLLPPELHSVSSRHIFFHHAVVVDHVENSNGSVTPLPCFGSPPDEEGFHKGVPGAHAFPFRMRIPIGKGAKGVWKNKQGAVRYIVIGSASNPLVAASSS